MDKEYKENIYMPTINEQIETMQAYYDELKSLPKKEQKKKAKETFIEMGLMDTKGNITHIY